VNHIREDHEQAMEKAMELANKISEKGPIAIKAAK
jgi:enoyl-CoA hydratase/carnithine racemase